MVSLTANRSVIEPGQAIAITTSVRPNNRSIYAAEIRAAFDQKLFNVTSIRRGSFLGNASDTTVIAKSVDGRAGTIEYGETRTVDSNVTEPGSLVQFNLRASPSATFDRTNITLPISKLSTQEGREIDRTRQNLTLWRDPVNASVSDFPSDVTPGETFTANVTVDSRGSAVFGAEATLEYNASVLKATQVQKRSYLGSQTIVVVQEIDNQEGSVTYAEAVTQQSPIRGNGTVFQIRFQVRNGTRGTMSPLTLRDVGVANLDRKHPLTVRNGAVRVPTGGRPTVSTRLLTTVNNAGNPLRLGIEAADFDGGISRVEITQPSGRTISLPLNSETPEQLSRTTSITLSESTWNDTTKTYEAVPLTVRTVDATGNVTTRTLNTTIYMPGDANGDGRVDIFDAARIGSAWSTARGQSGYSDNADMNNDGSVDIFDAVTIGQNWEETAGSST
jgi:hypothetical protein